MIAMLICSVGDFFMVNSSKVGPMFTYIGAGLFIAGHIVYGGGFFNEIKAKKQKITNSLFFTGLSIMLISVIILAFLEFAVAERRKPIMFILIIFYITAIGYNVCSMFAYAKISKGLCYFLPIAVLVFYITDIFIFLDLLEINSVLRKYVWYFYPVAQLVIILFNSPIKRQLHNKEGTII